MSRSASTSATTHRGQYGRIYKIGMEAVELLFGMKWAGFEIGGE